MVATIRTLWTAAEGANAGEEAWLKQDITLSVNSLKRRIENRLGKTVPTAARSRKTWLGSSPENVVPRAIGYDETWRIFVNVAPEELHDLAGLGQRKAFEKGS